MVFVVQQVALLTGDADTRICVAAVGVEQPRDAAADGDNGFAADLVAPLPTRRHSARPDHPRKHMAPVR